MTEQKQPAAADQMITVSAAQIRRLSASIVKLRRYASALQTEVDALLPPAAADTETTTKTSGAKRTFDEVAESVMAHLKPPHQVLETVPPRRNKLILYTDGATPKNGQAGAASGSAVFIGDGVEWCGRTPGTQTNQRAELFAAMVAAAYACYRVPANTEIEIRSDSEYTVEGLTDPTRLRQWVVNGWKTKAKSAVANQDLWRLMWALHMTRHIEWRHVDGHSGVPGNEAADQLAKRAAASSARAPKTIADAWPAAFTGISYAALQAEADKH